MYGFRLIPVKFAKNLAQYTRFWNIYLLNGSKKMTKSDFSKTFLFIQKLQKRAFLSFF